jgi:hypothetical protein
MFKPGADASMARPAGAADEATPQQQRHSQQRRPAKWFQKSGASLFDRCVQRRFL